MPFWFIVTFLKSYISCQIHSYIPWRHLLRWLWVSCEKRVFPRCYAVALPSHPDDTVLFVLPMTPPASALSWWACNSDKTISANHKHDQNLPIDLPSPFYIGYLLCARNSIVIQTTVVEPSHSSRSSYHQSTSVPCQTMTTITNDFHHGTMLSFRLDKHGFWSGVETYQTMWLLRIWFDTMLYNTLVFWTCLLYGAETFRRFMFTFKFQLRKPSLITTLFWSTSTLQIGCK